MGSCCCSSEEEEEEEEEEEDSPLEERVRLVEPPGEQDRASTSDSQSSQDVKALLSAILAKAANSIIDVAARSRRLAPREYMDRARLYYSRLTKLKPALVSGGGGGASSSGQWSSCCSGGFGGGELRSYFRRKGRPTAPLPSLTNQPLSVLAAAPVSHTDVLQAARISAGAHPAMQHVRVQPQEELVVHFEVV